MREPTPEDWEDVGRLIAKATGGELEALLVILATGPDGWEMLEEEIVMKADSRQ